MTMFMFPPSAVVAGADDAALALAPAADAATVVSAASVDLEAASDDALSGMVSVLDDSFLVLEESGIDEALRFLADRAAAEKARIRVVYGDAGREALAEARSALRACIQIAGQPAVADA